MSTRLLVWPLLAAGISLAACRGRAATPKPAPRAAAAAATRATFANPIVDQEAGDPWVVRHGDRYYFTATLEPDGGVWVWESATLTGLGTPARRARVWQAPASGPVKSM